MQMKTSIILAVQSFLNFHIVFCSNSLYKLLGELVDLNEVDPPRHSKPPKASASSLLPNPATTIISNRSKLIRASSYSSEVDNPNIILLAIQALLLMSSRNAKYGVVKVVDLKIVQKLRKAIRDILDPTTADMKMLKKSKSNIARDIEDVKMDLPYIILKSIMLGLAFSYTQDITKRRQLIFDTINNIKPTDIEQVESFVTLAILSPNSVLVPSTDIDYIAITTTKYGSLFLARRTCFDFFKKSGWLLDPYEILAQILIRFGYEELSKLSRELKKIVESTLKKRNQDFLDIKLKTAAKLKRNDEIVVLLIKQILISENPSELLKIIYLKMKTSHQDSYRLLIEEMRPVYLNYMLIPYEYKDSMKFVLNSSSKTYVLVAAKDIPAGTVLFSDSPLKIFGDEDCKGFDCLNCAIYKCLMPDTYSLWFPIELFQQEKMLMTEPSEVIKYKNVASKVGGVSFLTQSLYLRYKNAFKSGLLDLINLKPTSNGKSCANSKNYGFYPILSNILQDPSKASNLKIELDAKNPLHKKVNVTATVNIKQNDTLIF